MNVMTRVYIVGETAASIAVSVEEAIRRGRIGPGDRLPTVRELAARLGVSPATVAAGYRDLRIRGLIQGRGRSGTVVTPQPPVGGRVRLFIPEGMHDLASGNPDPELLPDWSDCLDSLPRRSAMYGAAGPDPELLDLARRRFGADSVAAAHLTVVSGALDGLERVFAARLRPGDAVAVEDPAYPAMLDLLRTMGMRLLPVAIDDAGMLPESLERSLAAGARAVLATPRSQNPLGSALDPGRRRELRSVLGQRPDLLIVEDDHAESVGGGEVVGLADATWPAWAVVRSVSKTLGPDLRLAVISGDATTVDRVEGRMAVGPGWVSTLLQRLVVGLWSRGDLGRQQRAAAVVYARRREALIRALAGQGIAAHGRSGLNVWIPVGAEAPAVAALAEAGYVVLAGERFRIASPPAVRITTARLDPVDAPAVAAALAAASAPGTGRTA